MILHVFGEPVHVADDIADGVYSHAHVVERLIAGGASCGTLFYGGTGGNGVYRKRKHL